MDAESVEKEIKEIQEKISKNMVLSQPKINKLKELEKELNDEAMQVIKWRSQIEALKKVLNN